MFPELPWDWRGISMNDNITIEFIKKYHDLIVWKYLPSNTFALQNYLNKVEYKKTLAELLPKLPNDLICLICSFIFVVQEKDFLKWHNS
jgi:hypothetical protein